jgi:tetratricopeptide (TPR) repeat protein
MKKALSTPSTMKRNFKYHLLLLFLPLPVIAQRQLPDDYLRGLAFFRQAVYDSSIVYFTRNIEKDKPGAQSWYYRGSAYLAMGETDKALEDFLTAEKSEKGKASWELAKIAASRNDLPEALRYLEINLQSNYNVPESKVFLDPDFSTFEKNPAWIDFWNRNTNYSALDALLSEANQLIKSGAALDAINLLTEGLSKGYRKAPLYSLRGSIYLTLKNDKLALSDLNSAIESDQRNARLYLERGRLNYRMQKYEQAVNDYQSALKLQSDLMEIYPLLGQAKHKASRSEEAVADFTYYLRYFSEDAAAWYHFGVVYKESGKYFNALECFNKCIAKDQNKADYYNARGETYLQTRTWRYADNDFAMALDLEPGNARTYLNKGLALIQLGQKEEACFCFSKASAYGLFEATAYQDKYCK